MDNTVNHSEIVSSESDTLILVDDNDQEIGEMTKDKCHSGDGTLHRAFSLFIFNDKGDVLLQQRSNQKRLWPMYWSNSCCSHPRAGETMDDAVNRRLHQELGLQSELQYVYKFQYHAPFGEQGSERELCWVYLGMCDGEVKTNSNEIADWRFINSEALEAELADKSEQFTPWFKMEWQRLNQEYSEVLRPFLRRADV